MMNADKRTFLTPTSPANKHTNIRYYISKGESQDNKDLFRGGASVVPTGGEVIAQMDSDIGATQLGNYPKGHQIPYYQRDHIC
jgi:hypothetical protein